MIDELAIASKRMSDTMRRDSLSSQEALSNFVNAFHDYDDDLDFGYADGSVSCAFPDLRYVFALALGAVVVVAALVIAAVRRLRYGRQNKGG